MQFLSLDEPVAAPAPTLTRRDAVALSVALHLLAALLILTLPRHLPASIRVWLEPRPPRAAVPPPPPPVAFPKRPARKPLKQPKIPMQFAYLDPTVRAPEDATIEKNPNAPILSDKNRRARQEVPTPPGIRPYSIDPHSKGDTIERVRPDPSLKQGRDSLEPPKPASAAATAQGKEGEAEKTATAGRNGRSSSGAGARTDQAGVRASGAEGEAAAGSETRIPRGAAAISDTARDSLRRALEEASEERKRTFDNPGFLATGAYGTMSFDTQSFPWGDYERQVHTIIDNHWGERLPLAWREGIRGFTCAHWVVERDGTISRIDVVRPSTVPPFDRAVIDALRASSPLPPLPEAFPEDREGVTGCFFYNMLPGEVREALR